MCFIPITHHDLGYTDTIEELFLKYDNYYDNILKYCEITEDWSEESKYKYTVETSWSLQHFLQNRPKHIVDKFVKYAKEGRIEVSALYANVIDAICGHEELIRLLYPSFRLKYKYGIAVETASIVDIPGLAWGLSTVLSKAGIKYLFAGLPAYFEWPSKKQAHTFWDEPSILRHGRPDAFLWKGPDGSSVLVYYQGSTGFFLGAIPSSVTCPDTFDDVMIYLPDLLDDLEKRDTFFNVVRYIDHGVDNYPPQINISYIVREWNKRFAYPKLIVATNRMFFEKLDNECSGLHVFKGELPHTDYAVAASSASKETAINRITHNVLQSAENVALLDSVMTGQIYPHDKIRKAYEDIILYDEHCFGMYLPLGKIQEWNWSSKSHYAYRAAAIAQSILVNSAENITSKIKHKAEGNYITVFNPLSFQRTDVVRVSNFIFKQDDITSEEKKSNTSKEEMAEIVNFYLIDDDTGENVDYQIIEIDKPELPIPYASERYSMGKVFYTFGGVVFYNYRYDLSFIAKNVPAMGYKTYKLIPAKGALSIENHIKANIAARKVSLENDFYKIKFNEQIGAIESIYDKELMEEIVDPEAPHKFNQLITRWVEDGKIESPKEAKIIEGFNGPVCKSIQIFTHCAGCPQIVQEITIYNDIKKIDIANRVLKDSTPFQEVYFAFPFNIADPHFKFEGTNSIIEPFKDQFPGSNTNYYTVQHWAEVSNERMGIVLSSIESHTLEFGGLWPCYVSQAHHGIAPVDFGQEFIKQDQITKGHIYSFIIDSNFRTNFSPTQQSDLLFRYSITTNKSEFRKSQLYQFGWGVGNPLVPIYLKGGKEGILEDKMSFCEVSQANILILTLKKAEDENGIIARLIEMEGKDCNITITFPFISIKDAYLTNIVEENERILSTEKHKIELPINAYGIVTIRIETEEQTGLKAHEESWGLESPKVIY